MKKWYQSKSIWYAIVTGVAGIVGAFALQFPEVGVLTTLNSFLVIVLRLITSAPILPTDEQ